MQLRGQLLISEVMALNSNGEINPVTGEPEVIKKYCSLQLNLGISEVKVNFSKPEEYMRFEFYNTLSAKYVEPASLYFENGQRHAKGVHLPYSAILLFSKFTQDNSKSGGR